MNCENCDLEHDGKYGSGRFCSQQCSRSFSTKAKRKDINNKVSKKLKGISTTDGLEIILPLCIECTKNKVKRKGKTFCSRSCQMKYRWKDKEYKKKISKVSSDNAIKRHNNPDIEFGWKSRNKLEPSYPESIAIRYFEEVKFIEYEREYKVGKYFIDFALIKRKIAIEIDGRQHDKEERKIKDIEKDYLLKSLGWTIFRIKYPTENIRARIKEIIKL